MTDHRADLDRYRVTPETVFVEGDDEDLDVHPITLSDGTVLDEAAAEAYGQEVADRAAAKRGRPSLSGSGAHSPRITVRLPEEVYRRFAIYAEITHQSISHLARTALLELDAKIVAADAQEQVDRDAIGEARFLAEAAEALRGVSAGREPR